MKNNIIITGGGTFNKGAQAMTFLVVDRLKKMFPNKNIVLFSQKEYYATNKDLYNFIFFPNDLKAYINAYSRVNIFKDKKTKNIKNSLINILEDTAFNIDISGFKLSSQFGIFSPLSFLLERALMKRYKIPQYIFPQSFGPFDFSFPWSVIIKSMTRKYLKYPKIIYCREEKGYQYLSEFKLNNLKLSIDSVFYSKELDLENIFKKIPEKRTFEISNNSVAIIPNENVLIHNKVNNIPLIYRDIIDELLSFNKKIYVFRHSSEDLDFCKDIKNQFSDNQNVILLEDDLFCFELLDLLSKFDYVIASRYHSIVHSYLNGVPALLLGWSFKYEELAKKFDQSSYFFDIRNKLSLDMLKSTLKNLNNNYIIEKEKITSKLEEIRQYEDIFLTIF